MKLRHVRFSAYPLQYLLSLCLTTASGTAHMSVYHASTPGACAHKYTEWWRERRTRRQREHSGSDEASPSLCGGLLPLMGGEDRTLLLAATGLRGREGKLMAAREHEGRGGGIEVERGKQEKEKEMKEREGWRKTARLFKLWFQQKLEQIHLHQKQCVIFLSS